MRCSDQNRLERVDFYQGQLLKTRDLQDASDRTSRLGGLHIAAAHDTWGIALGYDVRVNDAAVTLQPGIAYDCHGRPIVLSRQLQIPLPHPADAGIQWYDLAIHYQSVLVAEGGSRPDCLGNTGSLFEERPGWRWHPAGAKNGDEPSRLAGSLRLGEEIPLARFQVEGGGDVPLEVRGPIFSFRRHAQGLVRPHIVSGTIEAEKKVENLPFHWQMEVDTAEAGFTDTPYYFAQLTQHPWLDLGSQIRDGSTPVLGPFLAIHDAQADSFSLDVRLLLSGHGALPETITIRGNWLGIEPGGGCPPKPRSYAWTALHQHLFLVPSPIELTLT